MVIQRYETVTPFSPAPRDYRMRGVGSDQAGVSLIEVLISVAVVGVLASIAVPALLGARRHANQTSAVASLRAIAAAQHAFATACGGGFFASGLSQLADPPSVGGGAFLAPDLSGSDRVVKNGYEFRLAAGSDGRPGDRDACNGVAAGDLTSSFVATARPDSPAAGGLYYWVGVAGAVFSLSQPIVSTVGRMDPPGAQPVGTAGRRPDAPGAGATDVP
jgi:prepilin-type N-terminal cleavage/methylation domain-containing protein